MTAPVSLLPQQVGAFLPPPGPVKGLTLDQENLIGGLSRKLTNQSGHILRRWAYYDGLQRLQNLGISIPEQLSGVRTVVDWPRICVDPLVQRARPAGFRLPSSTEIDSELEDHWQANDLGGEAPLAFLDALVAGRGYLVVGTPDVPGGSPCVTVESPLNMAVVWDPRTRRITSAYQAFEAEGVYRSVLHVLGSTIYMSRDETSPWVIDDLDDHGFDEIPVVRLTNRARSSDREGRSEISPAIMDTTDSACRTLLGMEIAREVYSIPHLYVLGASEADFVAADGTPKTALSMAMTKFLAFERDQNGELPQVGQFTAFDPSVFTKIIDNGAQRMAAYTGFPPHYFGQMSSANPASADAIRVAESGIDRRGEQVQNEFTPGLRKVAQLIWRFANGGADLPIEMTRLAVDWVDARTPTPAATSDAVTKQIAAGSIPATSDVTLAELGYSAVQRKRLEQDRSADPAQAIITALGNSIITKLARADNAIAKDLADNGVITATLADAVAAPATQTTDPGTQAGR